MPHDRREFLTLTALSAVSLSQQPRGSAAPAPGPAVQAPAVARALDAVVLGALGEAVLPEALGAGGRTAAVAAFARWLAAYRPVAEEMHGYGDAEITYTPPDPAPGWNAQLQALDLLARRKHRRSFARLGVPLRREVVRTALARVPGTRLPASPLGAAHVAVALLAHWAASTEATDLAYEARIVKGNCRPLAETARVPRPLTGDAP